MRHACGSVRRGHFGTGGGIGGSIGLAVLRQPAISAASASAMARRSASSMASLALRAWW